MLYSAPYRYMPFASMSSFFKITINFHTLEWPYDIFDLLCTSIKIKCYVLV